MIEKNLKLAFDFDGTLGATKTIQRYAKELLDKGYDVHIVTRRYDSLERYTEEFCIQYQIKDVKKEHKYLFDVAEEVGIPKDKIHFLNMTDKWLYFKENPGYLWHIDDDNLEVEDINKNTDTIGIYYHKPSWKQKCAALIAHWEYKNK